MTKEIVSVDTIINWIKDQVEHKEAISPSLFVDAAQKLNVLCSDEHAKLIEWQNKIAIKKAELVKEGQSVAKAKVMLEATDDYKQYLLQKSKIEIINEFIRISKLQARMKSDEMRGGSIW